jgi:hypothetical protein
VGTSSVADYCRQIEAHLTRVNGGHLVRIVGPAFVLVREWETAGIPLSIVERAIDQKAERHRQGVAGGSGRPLRIEFCEGDVRELFETWKRAVGISAPVHPATDAAAQISTGAAEQPSSRRPSLSRHLERVSERLSRLLGRQDLPEPFLDRVNQIISAVAAARERARTARGAVRDEIVTTLRPLDAELVVAARLAVGDAVLAQLRQQAASELSAFKARLDPHAWQQALGATTDRLIRERLALPTIDLDVI